jgi:hypothetical protein
MKSSSVTKRFEQVMPVMKGLGFPARSCSQPMPAMHPAAERMPRSVKLQTARLGSGGRMKSAVADPLEK